MTTTVGRLRRGRRDARELHRPIGRSADRVRTDAAPPGSRRRRGCALALVSVLASIAGFGFHRLFSSDDLRLIVPVAAVVPIVLVTTMAARGRPPALAVSMVVWSGAFVAWAAGAVAAGAGGPVARLELVRSGLVDGWAGLLDVAVPAPSGPRLLIVPAGLTWLAAALGAEIVVRTRARLLPALPPVLVLGVGTAFSVPAPGTNIELTAAFAGTTALLLMVRRTGQVKGAGPTLVVSRPLQQDRGRHEARVHEAPDHEVSRRDIPRPEVTRRETPEHGDGGPERVSAVDLGDRIGGLGAARRGRRWPVRTVMRSVVATVVVTAVGLVAGTALVDLGGPGPVDPRSHRSTGSTPLVGPHPLSSLAGWTASPDEVLLRVDLDPAPAGPVPLRLAVFDSYDGATWADSDRYLPAGDTIATASGAADPDGHVLPRSGQGPTGTGRGPTGVGPVTQDIGIAGLGGNLVPSLAQPHSFTVRSEPAPPAGPVRTGPTGPPSDSSARGRFAVDTAGGTLLRTAPLEPGTRLRLVSTPGPTLSADDLLALTVARTRENARYLAVPDGMPAVVRRLATVAAGRGGTPYQRAAMLRQYLVTNFVFDRAVPPGHSLAHVEHFLTQTRRGTSEQFATTFVLAARLLGLPTRLVVGFSANPDPTGPTRVVRGADALAWAEVHFDGVGWLPFFPTPRSGGDTGAPVAGAIQGESPEQTALVDAVLRRDLSGPPATAEPGPLVGRSSPASAPPPGRPVPLEEAAAVLGLFGLGYLALALGLPAVRRRRARSGARSRDRVVAAWQRAVEVFEDAGRPVPQDASPQEVVGLASATLGEAGTTAVRGLATLATLALFGEADHGRWDGVAGRRSADEAWRLLDGLERALRAVVPRRRRLARRLAPRSVWAEVRGRRQAVATGSS